MNRTLRYVSNSIDTIKISKFLMEYGYSAHLLTLLRHTEGCIVLNGNVVHMNALISKGDELVVTLPEEKDDTSIKPVNIPVDILYEDEDVLIIAKPAGMPIHPSIRHYEDTLANAVLYYYQSRGDRIVFRCMTRLDKDTSGVVLIAKNILSATILSDMVKSGGIHKEYLAIADGIPDNVGRIDAPIARKDGSVIERIIDEAGKPSATNYRVEKTFDGYSLVRLTLETGRTHQIRVHMRHIGHPLIGDYIYNPEDKRMGRQALHCALIRFSHPITGKEICIEAPMPEDMTELLQ